MLWMIPLVWVAPLSAAPLEMAAAFASGGTGHPYRLRGRHAGPGFVRQFWVGAEQFLDPVPALLHPAQRQAEIGDAVPDDVVGFVPGQLHQQAALEWRWHHPPPEQLGLKQIDALV